MVPLSNVERQAPPPPPEIVEAGPRQKHWIGEHPLADEHAVAARAPGYERVEWPEDPDYPITNFERRFLAQGMPIHKLMLRKV